MFPCAGTLRTPILWQDESVPAGIDLQIQDKKLVCSYFGLLAAIGPQVLSIRKKHKNWQCVMSCEGYSKSSITVAKTTEHQLDWDLQEQSFE